MHIGNEKKDTLILGKCAKQGLNDTILNAEKEHCINLTEQQKRFCLSLYCNGLNSYIFFDGGIMGGIVKYLL